MSDWAETHKPVAAARVHVLLASLMWTVVGTTLAFIGAGWLLREPTVAAAWLAAGSVVVGGLKSRTVLDRSARKITDRIRARGDGRCIGGFLSVRTWGLVAAMALAGRLLRGAVARGFVSLIYIAVGTALLMSSRLLWQAWRQRHPKG